MPRYLFQGSYTEQGLKGLLKEGGTKRREAVEQAASSVGGRLEAFYYAFGGDDFVIIVELPGTECGNAAFTRRCLAAGAGKGTESKGHCMMHPTGAGRKVSAGSA